MGAPTITKACFVYIYINLEMSEAVQETEGYPDHGFSACCSTSRSSNTSCLESGPNGSLGLLTSTNTSYLFEQECKEGKGLVTEIYYGWTGGYPYMKVISLKWRKLNPLLNNNDDNSLHFCTGWRPIHPMN